MGMRTFSGRIAPIEGTDSERFLYFAEDVTETRTMRASLLHAERLASLGTLAAGVAHEIKNPATAVLLTLQTLRRRIHDSVELSDRARSTLLSTLSDAEAGAAHIAKMVMDLGHLARPEDERLELVALDEVLRSAASLARSSVQRTAQLELELAPVWTYASAVRLAQVVLNLLVNASNARVRDVRPQPGRIILRCKQVDEQAIIEVEDDGPGIEPSIRARLFEPFATSGSGSGLGLYVSRQIVEAFGGQIEVVDRQGGGTIVRVRLRAARR
jgi:signal transduction histidine kinase